MQTQEVLEIESVSGVQSTSHDGEWNAEKFHDAVLQAQRILRPHIPEGVSLVDELIAERRLEALKEAQE